MIDYRVGIGFDIHRYEKGNGLFLGGVLIPCEYRFKAHSDGDIIIHSIIDSILGALPDIFEYKNIGLLFPDNNPEYKNISSVHLLNQVLAQISPWKVDSCDIILIMEKPKLGPKVMEIIDNLKLLLKTNLVNVKPRTAEGTGLIGRQKAASCICIIKLSKKIEIT
ncbi:MAG: 2-C-methyl-D-erythritol 2,4-cyclodiphosphate synthase [bacterium]